MVKKIVLFFFLFLMLIATFKIISDQNDISKVKNFNDIANVRFRFFSEFIFTS